MPSWTLSLWTGVNLRTWTRASWTVIIQSPSGDVDSNLSQAWTCQAASARHQCVSCSLAEVHHSKPHFKSHPLRAKKPTMMLLHSYLAASVVVVASDLLDLLETNLVSSRVLLPGPCTWSLFASSSCSKCELDTLGLWLWCFHIFLSKKKTLACQCEARDTFSSAIVVCHPHGQKSFSFPRSLLLLLLSYFQLLNLYSFPSPEFCSLLCAASSGLLITNTRAEERPEKQPTFQHFYHYHG